MLLKQIIITKSIPFDIKLNDISYTEDEVISRNKSNFSNGEYEFNKEDVLLLKNIGMLKIPEKILEEK